MLFLSANGEWSGHIVKYFENISRNKKDGNGIASVFLRQERLSRKTTFTVKSLCPLAG
jgi:hypothetical protein